MPLPQLRRVRWAVRAVLTLGIVASVAANILHARSNPISQTIAAWPPLALLLTVELISRVPVHRRGLAAVRLAATATIASIAAYVSYWHMVGVAARYGETGIAPYLLPLSVDGLVVVASVSLVELAGRIRALEPSADGGRTADAAPVVDEPAAAPAGDLAGDRPPLAIVHAGVHSAVDDPAPAGVDGRRPATLDDARRVAAEWTTIARDALATALRADGLSVSNRRASELAALLRADRAAAA